MIVSPTSRFLWCSLLAAPVALAGAVTPVGMPFALLIWALIGLVAVVEVPLTLRNPPGVWAVGPKEVRRAKGAEGTFTVEISASGLGRETWMEVGIALPPEIRPEEEVQRVRVPADGSAVRVSWSFLALKRGEYRVEELRVFCPGRLGFWRFRRGVPCALVFRVYPDLRKDRKVMANLLLNRGMTGLRLQRLTGQGRDYDQVREYREGDTPSDIHWKASAKRNSLVTKTYQIERTQEVYLAIDHSRLSARLHPTGPEGEREPVLERCVNAANLLAMAAVREGDLFGLMTFARHTDRFIRAGAGPHHLRAVQNTLFTLEPENVYPDIDEWVSFTRARVRRRALIVLLTDLSDATTFDTLEARLRLLSRTHVVVVAMIPLPGVAPLFSGAAPANPDPWARLAGHFMWRDLHAYRTRLRALRVPLLLPRSENLALDVVNQYLLIKQQQRL